MRTSSPEREERLLGRETALAARDGALVERERRLVAEEPCCAPRRGAGRLTAARRARGRAARARRLLADELSIGAVRADELASRDGAARDGRLAGARARPLRPVPPRADGYRLVALDVAPPALGESLEVEGERFDVLRLGRSPLPGDERRCVYLAA